MGKTLIKAFWDCGDSQIIEFAMMRARLNAREREAVRLVLDECNTQEEAAEIMDISTRHFQNVWRNAVSKLLSIPWVVSYAKDLLNS